MNTKPKESDWKSFRRLAPELRERYLKKVNGELIAILQSEGTTPTESFWEAEERIEKESRILRECLDGHSRSKMEMFMVMMCLHGMMGEEDLSEFSDELRDDIKRRADM
jgi:hypothetical protein